MRGPRARRGFDNHSRDAFAKYLADEDEYDFIHQAKRQRVVVGYASAVANIAASIMSSRINRILISAIASVLSTAS